MAKQEQLALLHQGKAVWNTWRNLHPFLKPDLSGASLWGANLSQADLRGANLSGARLKEAWLQEADLSGANLAAPS